MVKSPGLLSRRYSIVVADRNTGVVRRFNLSLRPALLTVAGVFALPVLIGLGARWSASAELDHLRAATGVLRQENASFREATGELTGQIAQLEEAITTLSEASQLDPATRTALSTLPALVRNQAKGGAQNEDTRAIVAAATRSPEDAFGLLRGVLGSLERHLSVTKADVLQRNEVAQATPSIWPAMGWLTSGFGVRSDPFTGRPASHPGLDISGKCRPWRAGHAGFCRRQAGSSRACAAGTAANEGAYSTTLVGARGRVVRVVDVGYAGVALPRAASRERRRTRRR